MQFKLWLLSEVKAAPDVVQGILNQLEEKGFVNIWVDHQGNIGYGYDKNFDIPKKLQGKMFRSEVYLDKKNKVIRLRHNFSNKLLPATKKIIKFLLHVNIVDDDWTIEPSQKIGEYLGQDYKHFPGEYSDVKPSELVKKQTFTRDLQEIELYHGTSERDWERIQKSGFLVPLFSISSTRRGFESRGKHKYNKNILYLASNQDLAWHYAKTRTRSVIREESPDVWQFIQHNSPCDLPIKPILLKVHIKDIAKLVMDDDQINNILKDIGRKLWEKKSDEEKKEIERRMGKKHGFDVGNMSNYYWWEDDEGFEELLQKLPVHAYKKWYSSIMRSDQVGYKGIIPLSQIEQIPICS